MNLSSKNEWGRLRSIVVGSATNANWPSADPVFSKESEKTLWKETPVPSGAVPQWVIDETNEDLENLVSTLKNFGVDVYRPTEMNFVELGGLYNYCPRDRLIVAGNMVIDPAMMYPCRDQEIIGLQFVLDAAETVISMPRNSKMVLDAANISRLGDTWLCLLSDSGNQLAADWLQEQVPDIKIETCDFYSGVHIDSTISPLRDGLVLLNAARVNEKNCPSVFKNWDKIWILDSDIVAQKFYEYPYASKWIGMNVLSIDPETVIVDKHQIKLISILEKYNFTVVPLELRHSRTLGGGFHCVTLDLVRE